MQWHQQVTCDYAQDGLREINNKLDELTVQFVNSIRKIFYEPQQVAWQQKNYPLLAISAQMAEVEMILYAVQSRAMYIAQDLVSRYCIARSKPLPRNLVEGKPLIDLLVRCVIDHSIDNALESILLHRKKIYLQLLAKDDVPGVRELAIKYASSIAQLRLNKQAGTAEFDRMLEFYVSPQILTEQHKMTLLKEINAIISEAIRVSNAVDGVNDTSAGVSVGAMVKRHVNPMILEDIKNAKLLTKDEVPNYDLNHIQWVAMDEVAAHEDKLLFGSDQIASVSNEIRVKLDQLTEQFDQDLQAIFYEPQKMKINSPLLTVSVQMAEILTLLHTDERRMYMILRHLIEQVHYNEVNHILAANRKPVDIFERRLNGYAVDASLHIIEWRLKRLYLVARRYVDKDRLIRMLCREFNRRLNAIREKVARAQAEIVELSNLYRLATLPAVASETMQLIDGYVNEAIVIWKEGPHDNMRYIKGHVSPQQLADIMAAKSSTGGRVRRPTTADIAGVGHRDLQEFEQRLLAFQD